MVGSLIIPARLQFPTPEVKQHEYIKEEEAGNKRGWRKQYGKCYRGTYAILD